MIELEERKSEIATATYILTMDLGEKLESLRHIGINAPGSHDDYTHDIQSELIAALQDTMPENVEVAPVYMRDLADNIIGEVSKVSRGLVDPVIVSTCPEIAVPSDGVNLEINRIIDSKGRSIGIGPRPGNKSLEEQIGDNLGKLEGRDIIIVEDGIFSGATMRTVAQKLQERKLNMSAMVAGFSCKQSSLNWLQHTDYELTTTAEYNNVVDWIPDHDFLPFVPGGGKVLGVNFNDKAYPFYDKQKVSYAVPYIQPYGKTAEWASISHDKAHDFSIRCLNITRALFRDIAKLNPNDEITIGKLTETRRRTSVPLPLEKDNFPSVHTRVIDYLNEMD